MARSRKDSTSGKTEPASSKSDSQAQRVDSFPEKLAALDQELLRLAEKRIELVRQWELETKPDAKQPTSQLAIWEQQSVANEALKELSPESRLSSSLARELLRTMVGVTQYSLEPPTPVAYLGPMYSYSYLAASQYFSTAACLSPVSTIAAVFEEIVRRQAEYGVVPIENSTDGRIVDTFTMFSTVTVRICGEILLPIHHCLLGRCERSEIREVYSKPQALSQCRKWLSQHLPDVRLIEINSTTAAARLAADQPGVAAVASIEAGMHYGLKVIQKNIEDNPNNLTRFAVIGNRSPDPTGNDKTSIMFQVPHQSGALAKAMQTFSKAKLNLTWIESFPIPGNSNEYVFFIEFEGHQKEKAPASAIAELSKQTIRLDILGSYPRGKAING
jgi:chorismate mutase / prephenate dehydratase